MRIEAMLFHLTTEGHIRTSNEPGPADSDADAGCFASEQKLQELTSAWPMKRLVEIWNRLRLVKRVDSSPEQIVNVRIICQFGYLAAFLAGERPNF
jgi:hypothetical protein